MQETGERWRLGHRPALDGLRGVACLMVIAGHAGVSHFHAGGGVGVVVFFTLSGFLITSLLLDEKARTGRANLRRFYWRRCLRLMPALWVFAAVTAALCAVFSLPGDVLPGLTYIQNWLLISGEPASVVRHTWSLAVEEQFYLVWPPLLLLGIRYLRRNVLLVCISVAAVAAVLERAILWQNGAGLLRVYYGSDTRADALLVGCALAVALSGTSARRVRLPGLAVVAVACILVAGLTEGAGYYVLAPTVVPMLTAAVIFAAVKGDAARWLGGRVLAYVGRRSYGLYLWHSFIMAALLPRLGVSWPVAVAVCLVLSVAATEASWHLVERPFLRLKARATSTRRPADSTPATTATAATLAA